MFKSKQATRLAWQSAPVSSGDELFTHLFNKAKHLERAIGKSGYCRAMEHL